MSDVALVQPLPQLRMEIRGLVEHWSSNGGPIPPTGYGMRTFRTGDEDLWLALLRSGEFGTWDRRRLDSMPDG